MIRPMRSYRRSILLVGGVLLIVSAYGVAKSVCHTESLPDSPGRAAATPSSSPQADTAPAFNVGFGVEVREEACVIDLRLPGAFAAAGIGCAVVGLRQNRG